MTEEEKEGCRCGQHFSSNQNRLVTARQSESRSRSSQPDRPRMDVKQLYSPLFHIEASRKTKRGLTSAHHLAVLLENWASPSDPLFLMLLSAFTRTFGSTLEDGTKRREIFYYCTCPHLVPDLPGGPGLCCACTLPRVPRQPDIQ